MTDIKIGGQSITPATERSASRRLSMLLWGSSGSGKTTLAATAPGRKLLVSFDPDGDASIPDTCRDSIDVLDLSAAKASIADQFKNRDNPLNLKSTLEDYDTYIFDSLTNVAGMTLSHGVPQAKGATIERPSPSAYQIRNALALQLVKNALRMTAAANKHCIFIAHEAAPTTNDDGVVLYITIMLGGQLPEQATVDFSEVWTVHDTGKDRLIGIRPSRSRKPVKTRMFTTTGKPEFVWRYNPDTGEGSGIENWYSQWQEKGFAKIPLPT